ncbi:hypothetical protein [Streptomyces sp. NPDC003717]|uniref:hypothetical protein n=1 Tax=Streptomyces sp. NPDC003717 TaxID=3154276 RepID=UPI0033BEABD6
MARRPEPPRITVDGQDVVALTVEEYERLLASRRQTGAQSARVRALTERVRRAEHLVRDLEGLLAAPDGRAVDLRDAVAELLRRHGTAPT